MSQNDRIECKRDCPRSFSLAFWSNREKKKPVKAWLDEGQYKAIEKRVFGLPLNNAEFCA